MVNLINIFVKNKKFSYSNLGKARSYSYDGLGNRIDFKEYEKQIGYEKDGLKTIFGANLSELTPSYEENYILDRTRIYHNLLQRRTGKRGVQAIQSYVWDFNVAYMEEGEKEFTYLQDELGSTIRLLEQGGESQTIYGYDEFGKAMADAAMETILKTNGIALETGGHVAPNLIYDYNVRQMNIRRKVKHINGQYGDLYDIWNGLHPHHYFVTENKNCITSN